MARQIGALAICTLVVAALQFYTPLLSNKATATTQASSPSDNKPELVVQRGHAGAVTSVAFSTDGSYAVTGGDDGTTLLWEAETGREIRRFPGLGRGIVQAVAFSPNGEHILTCGNGTVLLRETKTGSAVLRFDEGHVESAVFSPDGKYVLSGSEDNIARLREADTGRVIQEFNGVLVAFSPDGQNVLTYGLDRDKHLERDSHLWNVRTGEEVRRFEGMLLAFSPDGRFILTASEDKSTRLFETTTGREVKQLLGGTERVSAAAFSPDGRYILTSSADGFVRLWEAETGKQVRTFDGVHGSRSWSVAFSPDGHYVLFATDRTYSGAFPGAALCEVETGKLVRSFRTNADATKSAALSPDGKYLLVVSSFMGIASAWLWDIDAGRKATHLGSLGYLTIDQYVFSPDGRYVLAVAWEGPDKITSVLWRVDDGRPIRKFGGYGLFSPDAKSVLATSDNETRIWDIETGKELQKFTGKGKEISRDGKYVLTSDSDQTARLWETETANEVGTFSGRGLAISPDGNHVLTAGPNNTARLWDIQTHREVLQFEGHSGEISLNAFSPDGKHLVTASADGTLRLWQVSTGIELRKFSGYHVHLNQDPLSFSPDGEYLLASGSFVGDPHSDDDPQLWEVETGRKIQGFKGNQRLIISSCFSPDGKFVLTAGADGTTRLWRTASGEELCRLISFYDDSWAVVDPQGHFDTGNLEEVKGLHWIMPDEPMRTYSLEIFMRDYYEPRLLPRLLNGETFNTRSVSQLNRVQPGVNITDIQQQKDNPELVTVTVKVTRASAEYGRTDKARTRRETDVYDVRLFRNGQIVGQYPQDRDTPSIAQENRTDEQRLIEWRETARITPGARVKEASDGSRTITFKDIHLPREAHVDRVEFSAYAFNEDRVKSKTDTAVAIFNAAQSTTKGDVKSIADKKTFSLPAGISSQPGSVYVVTVGVNQFQNHAWDLSFAVNDARDAQRILTEKLKQTRNYADVVGVSLVSDSDKRDSEKPPTKANFKAALAELARKARPEDTVIVFYSSHGYADKRGRFYLFPADVGAGEQKEINPQLLGHCISSDELSQWFRDVDAGEMLMVIDACHSAGSVKGEDGSEFKPGPMGSRGLGQLAYDKGMRILAASQADDFAFELERLRHGLLTYALIKDAIEGRRGDLNKDGRIGLSEALAYTLERVPKLYVAMRKGELSQLFKAEGSRGPQVVGRAISLKRKNAFQQPSLFDFKIKRRDIFL